MLPVAGGECRCGFTDTERPAMSQDEGPCVSVSFSDSAVIYENSYQESPGVWKPKRSTRTWLTVYANGGPDGGELSVSAQNLGKLSLVEGGPAALPSSMNLASNETFIAQYLFEGDTPSAATNDITVSGSLLPSGQSEAIQSSAALTSVKIELEAVYTAPENSCASRHRYGVGEKVTFRTVPQSDSITASVYSYNASEELLAQYNSFGGSLSAGLSADRVYTCPVSASFAPKVAVSCGGATYVPVMKIEDPALVVTREASWPGGCWPSGYVGEATLRTVNYIGPMHVSFQGIAVSEVPCYDVIPATGCFTQGVHNLSHTVEAQAGRTYRIKPGNYWCIDNAESTAPETNWVAGTVSTMTWKIPVGWHRIDAIHAFDDYWVSSSPDHVEYGNTNSLSLLIGGRTDVYLQSRNINAEGVFRTDKFGHWISRSRWCHVILDGSTVQWFH